MNCACDYETPEFYIRKTPLARKQHKCLECGCIIVVGERYENVRAKWEGVVSTCKTCPDCVELRKAFDEMECFCWSHGGLHEDVRMQLDEADFGPGDRFFYMRMIASHRKNK